jgi:Zn-dependent protease
MTLLRMPPDQIPFFILAILVAFTVHEFAHAWTAWKFGDDTAYREGRVTLNPMAHLDWIGFLFLLLAGFGWAKPVPVRRSNFRKPRLMSILVTAAGPISNLLLAFIGYLVVYILYSSGVQMSQAAVDTFGMFIMHWLRINMILMLFNLIPLPPLDGYRILEEFMPLRLRLQMIQNEQWTAFIFLLIVFIPPLRQVTIDPLFSLRYPILDAISSLLRTFFGGPLLIVPI